MWTFILRGSVWFCIFLHYLVTPTYTLVTAEVFCDIFGIKIFHVIFAVYFYQNQKSYIGFYLIFS